jgi:chloramphenicol-sensitive protein RarD
VVWSLLFVGLLLLVRPRRGWWRRLRASRRTVLYLAVAAVIIGVNWYTYIWAVNHAHVVETSLGYFINPLVTMAIGVLVLHERLNRMQWLAMGVALVAVVVLTVDYGRPPWIALTLAFSFALYALCKKKAAAQAVESLAVETAVLTPVALGYLAFLQVSGGLTFGHTGWGKALLLVGAGVMTAIPLLFFAGAATRIPLSGLGVLQYIAPTLQFLCGVLVFHEPMPAVRLVGFVIVWLALALFTWEALSRRRRTLADRAAALTEPAPAEEIR